MVQCNLVYIRGKPLKRRAAAAVAKGERNKSSAAAHLGAYMHPRGDRACGCCGAAASAASRGRAASTSESVHLRAGARRLMKRVEVGQLPAVQLLMVLLMVLLLLAPVQWRPSVAAATSREARCEGLRPGRRRWLAAQKAACQAWLGLAGVGGPPRGTHLYDNRASDSATVTSSLPESPGSSG
ncbi:hypothetical protein TSOC_009316 [Tetrabaena socialis]|uniref:Uncharacterized protein n=1 Tax=Tetrabaena socialis TaxID=47790 RepID=A0A2J7ZW38_9CHLO|nr:hypothetical protein TSOC_009316 [Tetrabaena socialis]|eukprot:PNH04487.1 hypothetical protein TSOC_009316 [Tetrabaena socialis]